MTSKGGAGDESVQEAVRAALAHARRTGSAELHVTDHSQLRPAITAIKRTEATTAVKVTGLSAEGLAQCAPAICDLVLELGVPVQFEHRGRTLQVAIADGA